MITQSSKKSNEKNVKDLIMTLPPPPPTYTCFRCGSQGHWIKRCPTNTQNVKRSSGIPRSFLVPVDGPEHKGALLTSSGQYAVPRIHQEAYEDKKNESPPINPQDKPTVEFKAEIPEIVTGNKMYNYSHEKGNYFRRYDNHNGDTAIPSIQVSDIPVVNFHPHERKIQNVLAKPIERHPPAEMQINPVPVHCDAQECPVPEHELAEYNMPPHEENYSHCYQSQSYPMLMHPPPPAAMYAAPVPPHHAYFPPAFQMFPFQPQPLGVFPSNNHQLLPPGVEVLLPLSTHVDTVHESLPNEYEDSAISHEERNRDPHLAELQRKLNKLYKKYAKSRFKRSRSRSVERNRPPSRSSYSSSKSWTRGVSRSPQTTTSHSRSGDPHPTRSRKKSRTPSRSRSGSEERSSTRCRTSRSRSRSRNESRYRRQSASREETRSSQEQQQAQGQHSRTFSTHSRTFSTHSRTFSTHSRTFSTEHTHVSSHRSGRYVSRHNYANSPTHFGGGTSY